MVDTTCKKECAHVITFRLVFLWRITFPVTKYYINYFTSINQSIQFWAAFIPVNGGSWIYHILAVISPTSTLHLAWFVASFFSKPTLLLSSTCISHIFFGRPCFLLPFTSTPTLCSKHARTISFHSPLPSEPLFPSIPTSPLGLLSSFSPSVLHHTLLSPLPSGSFSKMPFHFPSHTMSHSHITLPHNKEIFPNLYL